MTLTFAEEYAQRLGPWSDIQQHLPELYETAGRYPAARVLELGVRWGTSTAALLAGVEVCGGHLWSVDIAEPAVPDWWRTCDRWTLTVGSDLAPDVMAGQPSQIDVLFVDTSHVYEQTLAELRLYVPRVVPGGTVLCHDTELAAPEAANGQGPEYPVAAALDTYCDETGLVWVNRPGCYGLGVIAVPL